MMFDKYEAYMAIYRNALKRYQNRFYELGETPKALGWGCKEDQLERFRVMYENYDFEGKTVMDVGCGFADWYSFLLSKGTKCEYIGVDIIPEFINCCQQKYEAATFINANIMLEADKLPVADVVITNGTLNFKQSLIDNLLYTKDYMEIAFKKAKDAVIMDFLSTRLTKDYPKEEQVYYHNPQKILEMAFSYTDDLKLLHHYKAIPQKEFMLIMYKK